MSTPVQLPLCDELTGESAIEKWLVARGCTAPRLTPDHIDHQIVEALYHVFPGTLLTVCCIKLRNGFAVTGESACVSEANFDAEIGRKMAFDNARQKIWQLEGYLLRTLLAQDGKQ